MEPAKEEEIKLDTFDDIKTIGNEQIKLKNLPAVVKDGKVARKFTFYQKKYCQELIEHMSNGFSFCSFAHVVGVSVNTIINWDKEHPDFNDARAMGQTASYYFWQKLGLAGVQGKVRGFNANAWIFTMKNRFDWREAKETLKVNAEETTVYQVETTKDGRFTSVRPKIV